jgi:predicted dehydrogenase
MVRAAIIGLGRWGRSLVNSVQGKSEAIRFIAGYTRTREPAEAFCHEKGILLANSYEQILQDTSVDAVVLATPHRQHEEQIRRAVACGKHVFAEKPITLDLSSAKAVVNVAHKTGIVLAVGFGRRFHPSLSEIRTRLKNGRMGPIVAMVGQHTTSTGAFVRPENWRADPEESPAGAMTAVGVHLLDHMIELAGPARDAYCVTSCHGSGPADDTTTVLLRFENNVTGTIFCSVATATNFSFSVYGLTGLAELSGSALERFRFVPGADQPPDGLVIAPPDEIAEHAGFDVLHAELTEFARCIQDRRPYPIPLEDVLHGMAVFDAVVRSARTGSIERVLS